MKLVTYALLSCFLSDETPESVRNLAGTMAIILQVVLLALFNCRQFYILFRQLRIQWKRQTRKQYDLFSTPRTRSTAACTEIESLNGSILHTEFINDLRPSPNERAAFAG